MKKNETLLLLVGAAALLWFLNREKNAAGIPAQVPAGPDSPFNSSTGL